MTWAQPPKLELHLRLRSSKLPTACLQSSGHRDTTATEYVHSPAHPHATPLPNRRLPQPTSPPPTPKNLQVQWSPFFENKLAVASSANYGLVGNGRLFILNTAVGPAGIDVERVWVVPCTLIQHVASIRWPKFNLLSCSQIHLVQLWHPRRPLWHHLEWGEWEPAGDGKRRRVDQAVGRDIGGESNALFFRQISLVFLTNDHTCFAEIRTFQYKTGTSMHGRYFRCIGTWWTRIRLWADRGIIRSNWYVSYKYIVL